MTRKEIIKSNLSQTLKNSGLTPKEIADITEIKQTTIKRYIDKKCLPTMKNFLILTIALNLNVNDVLSINRQNKKK